MESDLTPLGELLEAARRRAKISQNEAARRAGVSGTAWRRIIKGVARYSGHDVVYNGSPETVALMARAVGVRADQLANAGRLDAAEELQDLVAPELPEIEVRADADPRILSILRNPVFTDEEKAWMIEALPRREPRSRQKSDTG